MKRSSSPNPKPVRTQALGAFVLAACCAGICAPVAADYQQTLAAKGADAFTPPSSLISIEQDDIQQVFSMDAETGNQAISDQDIMIELHARMSSESQLEKAAENLEPSALGKEPSASKESSASQESSASTSGGDGNTESKATVAAR